MTFVSERIAIAALAVLNLAALWLAPWAAINREVGARSAVLVLPNQIYDFTGRTDPLALSGLGAILILSALALLAIAGASFLHTRVRLLTWMVAGGALVAVTVAGLASLEQDIVAGRAVAVLASIEAAAANPRGAMDVEALQALAKAAPELTLDELVAGARAAGLTIRRLPYEENGPALGAFLSLVTGALALLFGLRFFRAFDRTLDAMLARVAVPLISIVLALMAAAAVVLLLQPTPVGRGVEIDGWRMALAGRLDTLFYAYQTLFADSLGTLSGFMASLSFATPLIFTGLAVAFGFRAGLFNIGAPGQMTLGAICAMLVGLYMPGPRAVVLPLAVLAAALGGAFWGVIPGWLKARFGAHEVINTILMNFIAASLLLFILSSNPIFSASALRIMAAIGAFALLVIVLNLIPRARRTFAKAPRLSFAVGGVLLLGLVVVAGLPRPGDGPVNVTMPFKVPGSEPKSYPLQDTARLRQVPAMLGIDLAVTPGTNVVPVNLAWPLALGVAGLALLLALRSARVKGWQKVVGVAVVAGALSYLLAWGFGLTRVEVAMPPTNLNTAFLLALLSAVLMHYLLWRTKWGYELRAVGVSAKAAEYGGASIARSIIATMAISGAFAGLTATHYVLGGALEDYALRQSLPASDGFDGIAVALLGGNTPLGVVLAAFLFGVLKNGGAVLNITFSGLTRDVVNMILALVVLFIAARGFLPERFANPLRRRTSEALHDAQASAERYPKVAERAREGA